MGAFLANYSCSYPPFSTKEQLRAAEAIVAQVLRSRINLNDLWLTLLARWQSSHQWGLYWRHPSATTPLKVFLCLEDQKPLPRVAPLNIQSTQTNNVNRITSESALVRLTLSRQRYYFFIRNKLPKTLNFKESEPDHTVRAQQHPDCLHNIRTYANPRHRDDHGRLNQAVLNMRT